MGDRSPFPKSLPFRRKRKGKGRRVRVLRTEDKRTKILVRNIRLVSLPFYIFVILARYFLVRGVGEGTTENGVVGDTGTDRKIPVNVYLFESPGEKCVFYSRIWVGGHSTKNLFYVFLFSHYLLQRWLVLTIFCKSYRQKKEKNVFLFILRCLLQTL